MTPRIEDFSTTNLCVHRNDAYNCLLCGTKPIKQRAPEPFRTRTPRYLGPICKQHNCANPCTQCYAEQWRDDWLEDQRREEVAVINVHNLGILAAVENEQRVKEAAHRIALSHGVRCWHDKPALECGVCRVADVEYNRDVYRREINEALSEVASGFRLYRVTRKSVDGTKQFSERTFTDGQGLNDLEQVIDVQIWQATRHYGPEMNSALARKIAKNTIATFQQDVIEDVSVLVGFYWDAMKSDFRQRAEALFRSIADLDEVRFQKLQTLARGRVGDDWKLAKEMIVSYGRRRPRFEMLDEPAPFDESDGDTTSPAEFEIHQREATESQRAGEIDMEKYRPALEAAVKRMHGTQRKVGEAILAGTFTARGANGVPPSTAARVRQVVLRVFRQVVSDSKN